MSSFRLAISLVTAILCAVPAVAAAQTGTVEAGIYVVPVTGTVEMGLAPFIDRSLDEAEAAGARLAILDIDTPGGRVDAAEQITDAIEDTDIPVYAFVNRRALSAGAMIALATDGIYMRPGSTLGAATPITSDGARASEKVVSAMRSTFRSLAEARGLDPAVAEAMVDEQVSIEGVVTEGQLLTLSTEEAVDLGFAREVDDFDALVATLGATGAPVVETRTNWAEGLVRFLTNPLVAPFLLSLGFLGLLIELKTPAFGLAGLAGATSLALFFGSHFIIGLAGWEVLLLLGLGVILVLAEILVIPGFGVAGAGGGLAIAAAIFLSMIGRFPTTPDIMTALNVLGAAVLIVGFTAWQLIKRLPEDRRARRILLEERLDREHGYVSARSRGDLVGRTGTTLTDLRPSGTMVIDGEKIDVVSDGPWVKAGTPVKVIRAEGYRHVVQPEISGTAIGSG